MLVVLAVTSDISIAEKGRTLGGYRFIPVTQIEDPFITTHFRNYTGLSVASDIEFPILVIPATPPDTLLTLSGDFVFVVASFQYQHAVHSRVAVRLTGRGASRVGKSSQALLSQGVTVLTDFDLGILVELWRKDSALMSAGADFGYVNGLAIDFVRFVEDVIDGNYKYASLVREDDGARGSANLRAAWALNRWAGLSGMGQIGFVDIGTLSNETRWRIAASGSVDFGQRGNAPVGLQLSVDVDRFTPQAADVQTAVGVGFGVYYTGREDLNLGLEAQWSRWPLHGWDTVAYPASYGLALRYFF